MLNPRFFPFAAMFGVAVGLAACKTGPKFEPRPPTLAASAPIVTVTNQVDPMLLKPGDELYVLGPGDILEVDLVGDPTNRTDLTVGPDGRVYFNILPGVEIWGLTLAEAKSRLEEELKKYLSQPSLNMSLRAVGSKYVWILGSVGRPGLYPIAAPTPLLEALALAGGTGAYRATGSLPKTTDLEHSFVMRRGQLVPVDFKALLEGDMSQNIYLRPDDFVFVASAQTEEVYVLGGVRGARAVPFRENLTVAGAIGFVGGTLPDAYETHIAVVRGSLSSPEIAVVDFRAIRRGLAADMRLQPRDIVFVPWQPWRDLKRLVLQMANTFVGTVAANEGSRWVNPGSAPLGISVSPSGTTGSSVGGGGGGGGGGR